MLFIQNPYFIASSLSLILMQALPICASQVRAQVDSNQKVTVGWIEKVLIQPEKILLHAKIDTGADTSSLNVSELSEITRDGERWAQFFVITKEGQSILLKKRVFRYVRIKRKGAASQRRPVVQLDLCLGDIFKPKAQVNLTDRRNFKYNMLIGRSFLKGLAIVDPSLTYSSEPHCHKE